MTRAMTTIKDALDALLLANAAGSFAVLGARKQVSDAAQIADDKPRVTTYYERGSFSKGKSSRQSVDHQFTFKIDLLVSAKASVDLTILSSEGATDAQRAAALAAMQGATDKADTALDAVAYAIWNIVMAPENEDLGLAVGIVADLWLDDFAKNQPQPRGGLVLLSGSFTLTGQCVETPTGETPIAGEGVDVLVKLTADVSGDTLDTASQGVQEGS